MGKKEGRRKRRLEKNLLAILVFDKGGVAQERSAKGRLVGETTPR